MSVSKTKRSNCFLINNFPICPSEQIMLINYIKRFSRDWDGDSDITPWRFLQSSHRWSNLSLTIFVKMPVLSIIVECHCLKPRKQFLLFDAKTGKELRRRG